MTINKSNFQPKDARAFIVSYQDEEDDEMSDLFPSHEKPSGKRMMTETQALVDFLKTTSPEEFRQAAPEKSVNTLFSRIRRPKRSPLIPTPSLSTRSVPSSTTSLPVTLASTLTTGSYTNERKKYIELVPQPSLSRSVNNSRSPSMDTPTQPFVLRNNSTKGEPILPNKKRDSTYSGSLRYSASIRSHLSVVKLDNKVTKDFMESREGMDTIESALLQRLGRIRLAGEPIPSDQVAAGLATEHVRALGITHILDNQHVHENEKTKVRHMQVQTETLEEIKHVPPPPEEKETADIRARRAEAALENAYDHFEAISGLAYKKLREIWEEKVRWESACMELRDRILLMEQKMYSKHNQYLQDDDELGLSEFPCSEN